jgi:hypothetical protein
MLELISDDGSRFTMDVLGYQYPDIEDDEWDSEWLTVVGNVSTSRGKWAFRDSCLTTFELQSLVEWFRTLEQARPGSSMDFTEPNLLFKKDAEGGALIVSFSQEAAPPWATESERYRDGTSVRLLVSADQLVAAVRALEQFRDRYPIRTR